MDAEVAEVDGWLAEQKTLAGAFPGWGNSYGRDHTARWGIVDGDGIQRGELAFSSDRTLVHPSIVVMMGKRMVFRLDLVPETECEPNDFGGQALKLPGMVCGSHTHSWVHNREWVRVHGFGELPYREPTPKALKTLEQALAAVADAVNIDLTTDQRDCRLPADRDLF